MAVVANIKRAPGHMYYVASDGRVMGGKRLEAATSTGKKITRKPGHLYYVDGAGAVHEKKAKYT